MSRRALLLAAVLAPWCSADAAGPGRRLPGYRYPEGWDVRVAAAEPLVVNPVTMTFGNDGRLYVVEWKAGRGPNDQIKVLTDTDGDGRFDRAEVFMDGLELPAGVLFWDGWVYVTLNHDVVRFQDRDGDGKHETREVIASGFGNDDSHHRVSGMTLGPDGWLYLTTGDSDAHARGSDGSKADLLRSGGVFRCKPDGARMENVAFGMRNPWGNVAFDDAFHIFHTDNDNEGATSFTGCRLLHVVAGGDYGWRLREGALCCTPDFERATWNGGRPGRLGWIQETGRGAPAGLCVLNSPAFPHRFRNLLIYPDVFRKLVRAYRLEPSGATYKVAEEFELLGSDDNLFRPTDAEVGPDGALYVLDWRTDSGGAGQLSGNGQTGRIYRLTWSGTDKEPALSTLPRDRFARLGAANTAELFAALDSGDDYPLRRAASLELIRRGPKEVDADLLPIFLEHDRHPAIAKLHTLGILWALHADDPKFRAILTRVLADGSSDVRRYAFELLGRKTLPGDDQDRALAALTLLAVHEDEPREPAPIRRDAAMALGRFGRLRASAAGDDGSDGAVIERVRRVVKTAIERDRNHPADDKPLVIDAETLLTISAERISEELLRMATVEIGSDPFLRDGVTRGLERLGKPAVAAVVKAVGSKDRGRREAALFALQGWRTDEALAALVEAATSDDADLTEDARVGLFQALREQVNAVPAEPVARWLAGTGRGALRSRVQAVQLLTAMHQRAMLAAGPILPALLRDPEAEVRRAALGLARDARSEKARDALLAFVRSRARSGEERGQALSALQGYDGLDLAPLAREVLPQVNDPGLKLDLIRALAARDFPAAAALAEGLLNSTHQELRHEAIAMLGAKPRTALVVARRYAAGGLPKEDLSRVVEAVRPHATPELQAALHELMKKTLLASPGSDEAKRLREFVGRHGNPDRGKAIYLDAKKGGCAGCHRLEGVGGNVGPDLTRVWDTLSFDKRLESILEPSREIKEGFGTFKVSTVDGRVLTGLLLSDTADGVTLKDAEGRERRIPAREIDEKGSDKTSLMPAGVVGHLSLNELADLLAFLGDRKAQEGLKPGPSPAKPNRP